MKNRKPRTFLAGLLLAASLSASSPAALAYSQLVIFADSLGDTGNNARLVDLGLFPGFAPGSRTPTPIPSSAFVPTVPYASDRYSNGPVWTDQFAAALGLDATASLLGGTNFAFGGALSGPGGKVPSLLQQTAQFLSATGGVAPSDALYVIEGGGNDVRAAAGGGDAGSLIPGYAHNIESILTQLTSAGARNILLLNVPNVGLAPSVQALGPMVAGFATVISAAMNAALTFELASSPLPAGVNLDVLDLFGLLTELVADPASFGFSNATTACAADPACIANPAGTFFWDGLHPTSAGAGVFAQAALAAIPEPGSLVLIIAVLLAGILVQRRSSLPARRYSTR
ncbi:MAG TPA: SGNH/GDSL hydrolase family protein [Burkholderiales bacterium]|nr:SGNH/GDSL hydrolase family protein [Burkholderiales bacterium]